MNTKLILLIIAILFISRNYAQTTKKQIAIEQNNISEMLDSFNTAASDANFEKYFNFFTEDAIFIGTDATEIWNKQAFMEFAKPYFEKKKTWQFRVIQRHVYFGTHNDIAWFDELLNTQMKICRGSGVVVKKNNQWKIQQYVLSMTIPNKTAKSVIEIKSATEDSLIRILPK